MLASSIKQEIIAYAERTRFSNPFMLGAAAGKLKGDAVARYLASLRFMLGCTPAFLQRSQRVAQRRGAPKLAAYFAKKLIEEDGHDAWAEYDMRNLVKQFEIAEHSQQPVPSILTLATYLEQLIDQDPRLYLTYILWAEFITALLGTELVGHLVGRCGVSKSALSSVVKHVELDGDHAEHGFSEVADLVEDPNLLPMMRKTMDMFTQMFDKACFEMVHPCPRILAS